MVPIQAVPFPEPFPAPHPFCPVPPIEYANTDGAAKKEPLRSKPGSYISPRLSPDGTRLAMMVMEQGVTDLWVYDLRRDAMTRLISGGGPASLVWSPDSRYVFFGSVRSGILWTRA